MKEKSLYKATDEPKKTSSNPNWQSWMGPVNNQENCGNCWAQGAVAVTEGLLHKYLGYNCGIDLDPYDLHQDGNDCDGGYQHIGLY